MKKLLALSLLPILLAGCTAAPSDEPTTSPVRDAAPVAVTLGTDPAVFDFGTVRMADGMVAQTFQLRNEGASPVTIVGVETSCMCTTAELGGETFGMPGMSAPNPGIAAVIPVGGETPLRAIFDPNAHGPDATGPFAREIDVHTADEAAPLRIRFRGTVVK